MKKLPLILLSLFVFAPCVKCDTIDSWHVFYNKKMIGDFIEYSKSTEIIIRIADIQQNDSMTVEYFTDTPCPKCPTTLTVEDGTHEVVVESKGIGTYNPASFKVRDLVEYKKKSGVSSFNVYYAEKSQTPKRIIFTLKLK